MLGRLFRQDPRDYLAAAKMMEVRDVLRQVTEQNQQHNPEAQSYDEVVAPCREKLRDIHGRFPEYTLLDVTRMVVERCIQRDLMVECYVYLAACIDIMEGVE